MQFELETQVLIGAVADRDTSGFLRDHPQERLASLLHTDLKKGLNVIHTSKELEARKQKYGTNTFAEEPPKTFFEFFKDALEDGTLRILMCSAVLSIVLALLFSDDPWHGWIEGAAILMAVFAVATVTAANDHNKDQKFRKLNEVSKDRKVKVVRDGQRQVVSIRELLVGDIVQLATGDYVPADGVFTEGHALSIDESTMTGEPDAIAKSLDDPWLIGGCMVMEGQGMMLVLAVGPNSQYGLLKQAVSSNINDSTPLEQKLEVLADTIGKLGLGGAILTLIALLTKWILARFVLEGAPGWHWNQAPVLVEFIVTSVTIVVVAVPEGLPLAVTLALAYSVRKMMKDQNLVRHLAACETMGGATAICSDKTGTLTQNKMTVVKAYIAKQRFDEDLPARNQLRPSTLALLAQCIAINSSAYIVRRNPNAPSPSASNGSANGNAAPSPVPASSEANGANGATPQVSYIGDKTECAMLEFIEGYGFDYQWIREQVSPNVEKLYPFSSKRKRMSVAINSSGAAGDLMRTTLPGSDSSSDRENTGAYLRFMSKGASEVMLDKCTHVLNEKGQVAEMDQGTRLSVSKLITAWAGEGFRTLCLCYSDVSEYSTLPENDEDPSAPWTHQLTLVSMLAIKDPLRPEVKEAVATCKRAGITVRMLTGDNLLTASHIAREAGIMEEGHDAIEGPSFRKLSTTQLDELLPRLRVVARCSPEDKMKLVTRLKELGEVVAVTGDGTNDAPQLSAADVGFSMGIMGTEVAKEASDIILLDDNFSSIVKAVLWGRNVFDAIKKFVQFQLTVNLVAVSIAFIGAVTGGESPLKAVQLLWVNLIMDTLAALALATESPSKELLDRPPYGRFARLITYNMWRNVIGQALYQLTVLFVTLYWAESIPFFGKTIFATQTNPVSRTTIVFNAFVFCQIFNEINARTLSNELNPFKRFFSNTIFLSVLAFTVFVQYLIVQFGSSFADTTRLTFGEWVFCVLVGAMSLPLGVLLRMIPMNDEADKTTSASAPAHSTSSSPPTSPHAAHHGRKGSNMDESDAKRHAAAAKWATTSGSIISQIRVAKSVKDKSN